MNNNNSIQLFEYESISYSDNKLKSFPYVIDLIEKLNDSGSELLSLNRKGFRAKQMVGLIQVKELSIEILQKKYKERMTKTEQVNYCLNTMV